jgi:3'-phosphoadenosine 5'-phosphosulfate sulfotransferase (PAPS reductase)/FAD synthetase
VTTTKKHVVMFSGGIGSWATAQRVVAEHGPDDVVLLFADVKGDNDNPHLGEDEDVYRFINDVTASLGCQLVTLTEGRSIWQVFTDKRFLGNSRLANCSHLLKQKPTREWLIKHCDPAGTTVYVGISWDEIHRLRAIEEAYASFGFTVKAPLCDPPYHDKADLIQACRDSGVEPPSSYAAGYPHANCGGACVRAGKAQWKLLMNTNRDRYLYHEEQEQKLRDHLGKDVTILREQVAGEKVRLTLRAFREREEVGITDEDAELDFGGCGCFVQTTPNNEEDE